MSSQCEVVVFENQSIYAVQMLPKDDIAAAFVEVCANHVNPEYIPESNTELKYGNTFISYSDRSGGDKPMLVVLTGITVDTALIAAIKLRLKELYVVRCVDCGAVVEDKRWVCRKCRAM